MNFKNLKMHFVGIGGISLSALAKICIEFGACVSGSDITRSIETKTLKKMGAKVFYKHSAKNVAKDCDVVVFSSAISEDNPELVEARRLSIRIIKRAELLSEIAGEYKTVIAVAGAHGKTTTTAMVSKLLIDAGLNPTIHLGGEFSEIGGNFRIGDKNFFVTEACEYKDNYLYLKPTAGVVLNVAPDHLDYFKTFDNVKKSFNRFLTNCESTIVNNDDAFLKTQTKSLSFSMGDKGDVCAVNVEEYLPGKFCFDCLVDGLTIGKISLSVFGKHNIYNALACVSVGVFLNISYATIIKSINSFCGVDRRFQDLGEIFGAKIIIDYAHHPDEIEASIGAARKFTEKKVVAIFQPHTFSRTQALMAEFAKSLKSADVIGIFKIYPARENPIDGVNHKVLAGKIEQDAKPINNYWALKRFILTNCEVGNTILLLGAGDFVKICDRLTFDIKI